LLALQNWIVCSFVDLVPKCLSKDLGLIKSLEAVRKELTENKNIFGAQQYKQIYSDSLKDLKEDLNER
jgi:hypothetical protein